MGIDSDAPADIWAMPLGSTSLGRIVDLLEGRAAVQRDLESRSRGGHGAVRSLEYAHKEMLRELSSSSLEERRF